MPGARACVDVPQLTADASDTACQLVELVLHVVCEAGLRLGHPHAQRSHVTVKSRQLLVQVSLQLALPRDTARRVRPRSVWRLRVMRARLVRYLRILTGPPVRTVRRRADREVSTSVARSRVGSLLLTSCRREQNNDETQCDRVLHGREAGRGRRAGLWIQCYIQRNRPCTRPFLHNRSRL